MTPAIMPWLRMRRITSSSSGWRNGSPPLMVMMLVPRPAKWSTREMSVSVGTGGEWLSYSLQYVQARLQRRVGIRCTRMGWLLDASPCATMRNSRQRRLIERSFRRRFFCLLLSVAVLV